MVKEILAISQNQLANLEACKNKLHVLDEAIIQQIINAQTEQNDHAQYIEEQCKHWQNENPTQEQLDAIEVIKEKISAIQITNQQIFFLTAHYKNHTIEKILAMSPEEIALATLNKKIDLPI